MHPHLADTNPDVLLPKIKAAVLSVDPEAEVILFGSRARGDAREDSDWDLLVLTNRQLNALEKRSLHRSIFLETMPNQVVLTPFFHTKKDWSGLAITPFYNNVMHDGKWL